MLNKIACAYLIECTIENKTKQTALNKTNNSEKTNLQIYYVYWFLWKIGITTPRYSQLTL